jgi:hypothetical protein
MPIKQVIEQNVVLESISPLSLEYGVPTMVINIPMALFGDLRSINYETCVIDWISIL